MSSIPIHTGQWTDWSHGSVLGNYHTYSIQTAAFILGGTSAFLTYVGGCAWLIYAFGLHRATTGRKNPDLVTLQHRSVYRNASTAPSAALSAFWIYWTWKPWKLLWPPHCRERRPAEHVGLRACGLILPALVIFGAFAAASVFSTLIVTKAYKSQGFLVRDEFSQNHCGITLFDGSLDSDQWYDSKAAKDTRAAVSYARTCYPSASGDVNPVSCSFFVTRNLNYTSREVPCPFGNPAQPFNQSICSYNQNNAAHQVTTALLDSHNDFGINAPPRDRLKLQKQLTCSPLSQEGLTSTDTDTGHGTESNISVTDYNYGEVPGFQNYTYRYNPSAKYDNVPFQIFTLLHNATGPNPWIPVSNLSRTDADVTIIFVAPNSVKYRKPVIDPFFKATYSDTFPAAFHGRITVYYPDFPVSVMGCVEQYSICTDQTHCTSLTSQGTLSQEILSFNLNPAQFVTAQRMLYMISLANTYTSVNGIGPDALKAWNSFLDFVSPAVPENQWKIEVEGWFETTLARWQAFMVEFVANVVDPGPNGHVGFPVSNSTLDSVWRAQCGSQKIRNAGGYQNVSIFGLAFIWVVGGFIMLVSWVPKNLLRWLWPERDQWLAWNIDGDLQQMRVALHTVGYMELKGGDDVPYAEETKLPLPFRVSEDSGGTLYVPYNPDTEMTEGVGASVSSNNLNWDSAHVQDREEIPSGPPTVERVTSNHQNQDSANVPDPEESPSSTPAIERVASNNQNQDSTDATNPEESPSRPPAVGEVGSNHQNQDSEDATNPEESPSRTPGFEETMP